MTKKNISQKNTLSETHFTNVKQGVFFLRRDVLYLTTSGDSAFAVRIFDGANISFAHDAIVQVLKKIDIHWEVS